MSKKWFIGVLVVFLILLFGVKTWGQGGESVRLLSSSFDGRKVILKTNSGMIRIIPYSSSIIRVLRGDVKANTDAVVLKIDKKKEWVYRSGPSSVAFRSDSIEIFINKSPLSIRFIALRTGKVLLEEKSCLRIGDSYTCSFSLQKGEQITGGGERALALNRRGYRLKLFNEPHYGYGYGEPVLNFSIPYFMSSEGYGLFMDNASLGWADIGKSNSDVLSLITTGGPMDYYVLYSSVPRGLVRNMARLTGCQPLPARWMLGNIQSRFGYQSQEEALSIADRMKKAGYPLDGLVLDLYWFGRAKADWRMGHLDWDRNYWPHPKQMIKSLKEEGVKTILITEPFLLSGSETAPDAVKKGVVALDSLGKPGLIKDFYFGPAYLLDLFKPKARDWFWQYYRRQIKIGVAGWWGDLGEPERHPSFLQHQNGKAWDVHNIYGQYWNRMVFEKYSQFYPNERVFHLNRSGFAGSQRYSIFPWSGDVGRNWSGLKAQIPIMIGMGLSEIPYMHSDLGGFAGGEKDEELYTRWLQMGVFNPIFRPHGEKIPSEPIFFSDSTQRVVREFIRLRYRMIPYNYSMAWRNSRIGDPLVRSLYWKTGNPSDFNNSDCYFWGDNLLVYPITEKGLTEKKAFVPVGKWFNFFTDEKIAGGDTVSMQVKLNQLPVWVKAGSFIPMVPPLNSMDNYSSQTYIIHYYFDVSAPESIFTLYEDNGKDACAFQKKTFETITIKGEYKKNKLQFYLTRHGGTYLGKPIVRKIIMVIHHAPAGSVWMNGKATSAIPFDQEKYSVLPYAGYRENPEVVSFDWRN